MVIWNYLEVFQSLPSILHVFFFLKFLFLTCYWHLGRINLEENLRSVSGSPFMQHEELDPVSRFTRREVSFGEFLFQWHGQVKTRFLRRRRGLPRGFFDMEVVPRLTRSLSSPIWRDGKNQTMQIGLVNFRIFPFIVHGLGWLYNDLCYFLKPQQILWFLMVSSCQFLGMLIFNLGDVSIFTYKWCNYSISTINFRVTFSGPARHILIAVHDPQPQVPKPHP